MTPGPEDQGLGNGFGEQAAQMANETEVEAPLPEQSGEGASAKAGDVAPADISGVDNWVGEGGPIEPSDLAADDRVALAETALAERTLDLQRLQAEYLNYKRRVERDRELVQQNATYTALVPIIEVLDTIDLAREHGEVEGGFKSVADQLERVVAKGGLVKFGAVGDAFDPTVHEALSSMGPDPEGVATVSTVKVVAKAGYKVGDRVVRAAQVLVVEPA